MFDRLFAESGLSLDRLRTLVEVGSHGSIVQAAGSDPVRQSQYSRQIKELEDFFQATLVERHGKGVRLTVQGRELARISRFFLLGLSNFQRGCLRAGQVYSVGAGPTFIRVFLLNAFSKLREKEPALSFSAETVLEEDGIERCLHDLTLDFGIVTRRVVTRPLQLSAIGSYQLSLWVPKRLCRSQREAQRMFEQNQLPMAAAVRELPLELMRVGRDWEPAVKCDSFVDAAEAIREGSVAAWLPPFAVPERRDAFIVLEPPLLPQFSTALNLAWNPRLLRLNPKAARRRDALLEQLRAAVAARVG